ncbi:MAG: response regulator transcription factor [Gammaproteobacteria bacterium]|jgi:DNA-binding NarL/FixJ family response regulator|nr:response regulator transcription factor [Gammaproteobacteria bacterium]MBT3723762.1 response regulator transcription factor [Gammaproteobacteria bacterium]MBT4075783.1 response regulator transcription factor [Gammaproteobacteria bacterium]MBT4196444.1 response regulator transcription factor [Gammaproteobacteria bacterium]MBT4448135.1 response regulator transcription factor [Gammaproteobacteria bacterium]
MNNILLIDDHAVVRKGLKAILEEEFGDISVDEADTGLAGISCIRECHPDAVVLDISLPDISGLDVLKRIRMEWPKLPVLILSIYGEDQYGARMLRCGASGYLSKSSAPEHLVTALKKVISGQRYISPELAEQLAYNFEKSPGGLSVESLSDREYQVFRMLAAGKTVTAIGEELHLSVKTISTHRHHILSKMEMRNNADIVSYAQSKGLLEQQ